MAGLHEYLETKHIWHNTRPAVADWFDRGAPQDAAPAAHDTPEEQV
ncbi:hypothetical protein [Serinicoccus marinus]